MKQDYGDITSRLGQPVWWDEAGCPRYAPFKPWLSCDFYAEEVALIRVQCQNCNAKYLVCLSAGLRDKRPLQTRPQPLAYGDPPGRCCAVGASMTSETIEVVELWVREKGNWRKKVPRSYFAADRREMACIQWHARTLQLLRLLLTPSELLAREIPRDKNSPKRTNDLPLPALPKRSRVLKRLARLGTPPPNLAKLSTFQLAQMLYLLESGEPS